MLDKKFLFFSLIKHALILFFCLNLLLNLVTTQLFFIPAINSLETYSLYKPFLVLFGRSQYNMIAESIILEVKNEEEKILKRIDSSSMTNFEKWTDFHLLLKLHFISLPFLYSIKRLNSDFKLEEEFDSKIKEQVLRHFSNKSSIVPNQFQKRDFEALTSIVRRFCTRTNNILFVNIELNIWNTNFKNRYNPSSLDLSYDCSEKKIY